jgi:hypothetical protein
MDTTIDGFITLFRGRGDCYGHDNGGCVRKPLDRDVFVGHLQGGDAIGVYPAVPGNPPFCVWGCIDIDVDDLGAARLMKRTLASADVESWVERSRSKGYHVWVFSSERVPAEDMRRMLLAAHQVAGYPAREVNPKQSDVSLHKVGNYVRLPYWGGLVDVPQRRVMLDDNDAPIGLDVFVTKALGNRTSPERIQFLASHYVPPSSKRLNIDLDNLDDHTLDEALRGVHPIIRTVWANGPIDGRDRSSTLMFLAHLCYEHGLTPSMCRVIVADADKRWGKFHLRGEEGIEQIHKLIGRAYNA